MKNKINSFSFNRYTDDVDCLRIPIAQGINNIRINLEDTINKYFKYYLTVYIESDDNEVITVDVLA